MRFRDIDTSDFRARIRRLQEVGPIEESTGNKAYCALVSEMKRIAVDHADAKTNAMHSEETRQIIGESLNELLTADGETDWHDSRNVDNLIDIVFSIQRRATEKEKS